MHGHAGAPNGIVFRRLDDVPDVRCAARLLAGCSVRDDPAAMWFGLYDLTATDARCPVGAAVIHPLDAARVQLSGLAVSPGYRGRGLGRRLVGEVADRLRAAGVEQLLAPPARDAGLAALLAQAGFVALAPGWTLLPL